MAAALVGVITDHSINAIAYAGLLAGENTRQGRGEMPYFKVLNKFLIRIFSCSYLTFKNKKFFGNKIEEGYYANSK